MSDGPQQLLKRILRSPHFQDSPDHSSLLQYICHQTQTGNMDDFHEHDPAVVSQLADEIRARLKLYFEREGRLEELRLALPSSDLRAYFYEADPRQLAAAAALPTALERFWAPYWDPDSRNYLIHGELPGDAMLIPEAYAAVQIAILFEQHNASLELHPAGAFAALPSNANIILTGTFHSNPFIEQHATDPLQDALQRIWATPEHGVLTLISTAAPAALLDVVRFAISEPILERALAQFDDSDVPLNFRLTIEK